MMGVSCPNGKGLWRVFRGERRGKSYEVFETLMGGNEPLGSLFCHPLAYDFGSVLGIVYIFLKSLTPKDSQPRPLHDSELKQMCGLLTLLYGFQSDCEGEDKIWWREVRAEDLRLLRFLRSWVVVLVFGSCDQAYEVGGDFQGGNLRGRLMKNTLPLTSL